MHVSVLIIQEESWWSRSLKYQPGRTEEIVYCSLVKIRQLHHSDMHNRNQKLRSSSGWVRQFQSRAIISNGHQAIPAEIVAGWKNRRNWGDWGVFVVLHSPGWFFFTQGKAASHYSHTSEYVQMFYFQINQHYYKEVSAWGTLRSRNNGTFQGNKVQIGRTTETVYFPTNIKISQQWYQRFWGGFFCCLLVGRLVWVFLNYANIHISILLARQIVSETLFFSVVSLKCYMNYTPSQW